MNQTKTLKLELSTENQAFKNYYYATLELPAKEYEVRDALQQIRAVGRNDGDITISVLESPVLPSLVGARIDFPTLEEMEFLAKRLAGLDEDQRTVLQAVSPRVISGDEEEIVSMRDLINMTYGLDRVSVISNIATDEQLGEFVIENDLNEVITEMYEEGHYYLDRALVGRTQREDEGGVFVGNRYVVAGEYEMPNVYDGERLPTEELPPAWYAFALKIAKAPMSNPEETADSAEWIYLPMSKGVANRTAKTHGEHSIETCVYFGFESPVPQITEEMFGDMVEFDKLNALAEKMAVMAPTDQVKFKAVLCLEEPSSIEEVLEISDHLHEYEFTAESCEEDDFFKEYLTHHLPTDFDTEWLNNIVTQAQGRQLINQIGGKETPYGIVSGRGHSLYEFVPFDVQAKKLTNQSLTDEKLDVVEVLGQTGVFTNGRVTEAELPDGLYKYDLVEGETLPFSAIKPHAFVNHAGTVLLKEPLSFDGQEYIVFDDESSPNFLGYHMTMQEFLDTDFTQDEDVGMTM